MGYATSSIVSGTRVDAKGTSTVSEAGTEIGKCGIQIRFRGPQIAQTYTQMSDWRLLADPWGWKACQREPVKCRRKGRTASLKVQPCCGVDDGLENSECIGIKLGINSSGDWE